MAMGMAAAPSTAPNNNFLIPFLNGDQKDVEEDIRNLLNIADIPLPGKEIPVVRIQIQFFCCCRFFAQLDCYTHATQWALIEEAKPIQNSIYFFLL